MSTIDHLGAALYFAARARRTRDASERARLMAVALKYRATAIAEAVPFIMALPKRPPAPSVRCRAAGRRRA